MLIIISTVTYLRKGKDVQRDFNSQKTCNTLYLTPPVPSADYSHGPRGDVYS